MHPSIGNHLVFVQNLPPISDLSESSTSTDNDSEEDKSDDEDVERKVTVQETKATVPLAAAKKTRKEVRIESGSNKKKVGI